MPEATACLYEPAAAGRIAVIALSPADRDPGVADAMQARCKHGSGNDPSRAGGA